MIWFCKKSFIFNSEFWNVLQDSKLLHKSHSVKKSLDPVWDEEVDLYLDLPLLPLCFKVYDKASRNICNVFVVFRCIFKTDNSFP